jgi:hypothetical protein
MIDSTNIFKMIRELETAGQLSEVARRRLYLELDKLIEDAFAYVRGLKQELYNQRADKV